MNIKTIARWTAIVPLFIIPLLALYISSDLFFPFISGKNFAFRALVEISLLGYVVLAFADKRYRPQFSWVAVSLAALVIWMFVADMFSPNAHKAFWSNFERMDGFVTLAHVFALFLIAGPVLTVERLWRRWWMTLIATSAVVVLWGFAQLAGLADIHQSQTRLDASLGNSEYLAGFLLIVIGITLWQAFASRAVWLRYGLLVLAVLQVLILFGTGTRGTFVALLLAAGIGGLMWLVSMGKRGRKGAMAFIAFVLVFAGGFYAIRNTAFIQESPNLSRFATISLDALETRFKIWNMALEGAQARPILGWGHEGYNYVFNTYYNPTLYGQEPWFDRAHNIYLDWLVAGGVPALLLFLLLGGAALLAVYRSDELEPWERVLILSALIGYGIQGLAVFDNLFTYVPIAMLLAYAHSLSSRPIARLERMPEVRGATLDTVVAPAALVVAVLLVYMVNIPTYAAGKDLIRGLTPLNPPETRLAAFKQALDRDPFATQEIREQLLQFGMSVDPAQTPGELRGEIILFAMEEMEKEIARAPEDARLHTLYASFLRSVGDFDRARVVAARARELSPQKQSIIIEQGIIEWQEREWEASSQYFDEAYALATSSDELATYAAAGRILVGNAANGKALLDEHFGTTTVNSMVLAVAYQETKAYADLIATLRKRYDEMQDAASGFQLALGYAQAGRIAEAQAQVRAVMAAYPESASQGAALLLQLSR